MPRTATVLTVLTFPYCNRRHSVLIFPTETLLTEVVLTVLPYLTEIALLFVLTVLIYLTEPVLTVLICFTAIVLTVLIHLTEPVLTAPIFFTGGTGLAGGVQPAIGGGSYCTAISY